MQTGEKERWEKEKEVVEGKAGNSGCSSKHAGS
jgi:hypothetical protein